MKLLKIHDLISEIYFFAFPFIQSQETCARIVCFITKNTVKFGRMANRLMNRNNIILNIEIPSSSIFLLPDSLTIMYFCKLLIPLNE